MFVSLSCGLCKKKKGMKKEEETDRNELIWVLCVSLLWDVCCVALELDFKPFFHFWLSSLFVFTLESSFLLYSFLFL